MKEQLDRDCLEEALKEILQLIYKKYQFSANSILELAAQLHRIGSHKMIEEHLEKFLNSTKTKVKIRQKRTPKTWKE